MALSVATTWTDGEASDTTTFTMNFGSPTEGSLLVAFISKSTDSGVIAPAESTWTVRASDSESGPPGKNCYFWCGYRIASSEPASYDWTSADAGEWTGAIL